MLLFPLDNNKSLGVGGRGWCKKWKQVYLLIFAQNILFTNNSFRFLWMINNNCCIIRRCLSAFPAIIFVLKWKILIKFRWYCLHAIIHLYVTAYSPIGRTFHTQHIWLLTMHFAPIHITCIVMIQVNIIQIKFIYNFIFDACDWFTNAD